MSSNAIRSTFLVLLGTVALGGCGGSEPAAEPPANPPSVATNPAGLVNKVGASAAIAEMRAELNTMENATAEDLKQMIGPHRAKTEALLTAMETEARSTGKTLSAEWQTTSGTVRSEAAAMAALSAGQLQAVVPSHIANVRRLMELHEAARP